MHILGIETSCDDTAAAVIEAKGEFAKPSFSVLSSVSYSQVAIHKKFGGIVPNLASRAHLLKIAPTVKSALLMSDINNEDIDLIAVTRGPGLLPSLLVGVNFARALAYKWQKPIIGINHIEGHIYSNWLKESRSYFQSGLRARSGHGVERSETSVGRVPSRTSPGCAKKARRPSAVMTQDPRPRASIAAAILSTLTR